MIYIGKDLREFREKRGLTQQEFADMIFVTRTYLARLESTSPKTRKPLTNELLKRICEEFEDYSLYDIWDLALEQFIKSERETNSIRKIC
jgi:transcriptional regulator with XRE-family HTH domain